ncbi:MAG: cysteine desulfurase family protein [Anaerolineae bacterium]
MNPRIYLDYCATTPVHPEVRAAMMTALEDDFGNPSSMHWAGRRAGELVSQARSEVAASISAHPQEIYFTGGATEADNLALLGVMRRYEPGKAHLVTTAVEHHAILHTAAQLEKEGYAVTVLPVDGQGLVDPQQVRKAIRPDTALISVMLVNNETGAIQPVADIANVAQEKGILMHTDAVQGMGLLDVNVDTLKVDLLSLSAHKIYGPKGVGALYVRRAVALKPLAFGGPQEQSLRPGTENVPGIVGLGAATRLTCQHKAEERKRLSDLRARLIDGLADRVPGVTINGPSHQVAPHVVSASFPGTDGEMTLIRLNAESIAVSLGSACNSKSIEPSHVLTAMGLPHQQIEGSLRISMGYPTTPDEINRFLEIIPGVVQRVLAVKNIID